MPEPSPGQYHSRLSIRKTADHLGRVANRLHNAFEIVTCSQSAQPFNEFHGEIGTGDFLKEEIGKKTNAVRRPCLSDGILSS